MGPKTDPGISARSRRAVFDRTIMLTSRVYSLLKFDFQANRNPFYKLQFAFEVAELLIE